MKFEALPWLILFLPLVAAGIIGLFTLRQEKLSAGISIAAVIAAFGLSAIFVLANGWVAVGETSLRWLSFEGLDLQFGIRLDPLSIAMMLLVTGVAACIHVYSWGYMHGDPGFSRFFAFLSLFTFSMLGIVLSNNFLEMFIFWELVGVSSYLLIGFWYEKPSAADAGKKAFITNRLGDFGFLLGILMVWSLVGSLNFEEIRHAGGAAELGSMATIAGLLIFCGAAGKSAQFPLHVWLPDAMEGPTPVSALIHAATMVAAGVYMLCRVIFLFNPPALEIISWIGGFTALLAALIAVQQNDIKRILAYSTLSQLGFMVLGVGLGAPAESMFHLSTHAFFKALLFLGAGSVILAMHHEQDIWKMGSLRSRMPVTFWTFLVGTLAIAGVWPLSGFFSKDAILARAAEHHAYGRFALGLVVAVLTAFYMFRLFFVVFGGASRSKAVDHAHESPGVVAWPLRILAVMSVLGGFIGIYATYQAQFSGVERHAQSILGQIFHPLAEAPLASGLGLAAAAIGFVAAWRLYGRAAADPLPARLGALSRAMSERFYFDELYRATFIRLHDWISIAADWVDRWLIGGLLVRGTHGTTELFGRAARLVQTGNLQTYAALFVLGVALVLYLALR